jgi:5-methylcytosine-specific restriction protein A
MPIVPNPTKCNHLGCIKHRTRFSAQCLEHGGREVPFQSPERKSAGKQYQTPFWKQTRNTHLSQHPLCAGCLSEGIITQAIAVDHVFPWRHINEHAFHHNLFQSLCHAHHTAKTTLEYKGIYRRYGQPTRDYVKGDYERVIKKSET